MNGQRQKRKPNWMQKRRDPGKKILQRCVHSILNFFPSRTEEKELHQHEQIRKSFTITVMVWIISFVGVK